MAAESWRAVSALEAALQIHAFATVEARARRALVQRILLAALTTGARPTDADEVAAVHGVRDARAAVLTRPRLTHRTRVLTAPAEVATRTLKATTTP